MMLTPPPTYLYYVSIEASKKIIDTFLIMGGVRNKASAGVI